MLEWSRRLRTLGVIGLNERNLEYINRNNPRRLFPLVDDKLETKLVARRYGVATPELLGVIRTQGEIGRLERMIGDRAGFVIKPSRGSGGKGILVIDRHGDGRFRKASGKWIDRRSVVRYLSNLLSGLYTLAGRPDVAVIESLIEPDAEFNAFSFEGVPDIRIVVYQGYPVMAMMRLSTQASDGKANLHQGAIGVGLDLARGTAVRAVQYDRPVRTHPDTGRALDTLRINDWTRLLILAARCQEMSGLGYLGADMVVDRTRGPLVLELNARPGLSIQMANGRGLKHRCEQVRAWEEQRVAADEAGCSPAERVARIQQAFADS